LAPRLRAEYYCLLQLDIVNRVLEWLHQGCDDDLSADFLNFGARDFPFIYFLKNASKLFFLLWRRGPVLELQLCAFYCVLQLNLCRSHCNGCVKVAWRSSCVRKTIVFCSWTSKIVLEWLHQGCHDDLSADFLNFGTDDFFSNSFRMYY